MTGPTIAILAGGRASRLGGGDKSLRALAGGTVLGHILARLKAEAPRIVLNANGDPARFAGFDLPVLPDTIDDRPGPLAGVLAAMEWAGVGDLVTVPGDAPFIPRDLVARLVAARDAAGADIAVAVSAGRLHPIVALWPVRLGAALRQAIVEEGVRKVEHWINRYPSVRVEFSDHPVDPFFNINSPEDLAEAERLCRLYPTL